MLIRNTMTTCKQQQTQQSFILMDIINNNNYDSYLILMNTIYAWIVLMSILE